MSFSERPDRRGDPVARGRRAGRRRAPWRLESAAWRPAREQEPGRDVARAVLCSRRKNEPDRERCRQRLAGAASACRLPAV